MCSCFKPSPGVYKKPERKEELKEETVSFGMSSQLKDIMVRVVHAGGRIEMYRTAIPASKLIQKYPDMCITRPDVFKNPHESLLSANEILLPGHKYFLLKWSSIEKLKRRDSMSRRRYSETAAKEPVEDGVCLEESICSAKEFFVSKESWSNFIPKKCVKEKKPFVPPIQRPRVWKEPEWEPSLTSIQELSP